ncbi:MAG: tail fiber protein [Henriciella sp.]|nr:tail fiber protein [Alcanivorax sp.]NQY97864.1 tail fiber protein [Henriciella sp.]
MIYKSLLAAAAIGTTLAVTAPDAEAYGDRYIGEIITVGYNFCPRGSTDAAGQLLPISQYSALFSLYGTIYGGDGRTTFALPDLRGRTMIGVGTGPGLSDRPLGSRAGVENNSAGPASAEVKKPSGVAVSTSGHNMPPYLVLRHCIILDGVFPSRN